MRTIDVVVIGAGQAGLSAAYFLHRRGLVPHEQFVVLDGNDGPGGAWRHRWPSLTLGGAHGIHPLPGLDLEVTDDMTERPSSEVVGDYFGRYEATFDLPVLRPVQVETVQESGDGRLVVTTDAGRWATRGLVNATGTWTHPFWPRYPGMEDFAGEQLHTADYWSADEFAGRHVVVVGGGHSAVQHLLELAEVTTTTWVTRSPPAWRDTPFDVDARREAVGRVAERVAAGRRPQSVVAATGLAVTDEIAAARADGMLQRVGMFDRITPDGVAWDDGRFLAADVILWATGFRHALDHLAPLQLRDDNGGIRMDGTQVAGDPRIHLLGYGPSASTIGANRAGRIAVRDLHRWLQRDDTPAAA
ncbi:MAG: NAD(P)-binding domain-containing protein [Nitriliruptorales bacterium]|nr:NAD(P)-binding domain-containing protein [Nitriliruptorales bacterium]